MSSNVIDNRRAALVDAFMELSPTWVKWVNSCLPLDAVSHARLRLLATLGRNGDQTMGQLATALGVTARRVTALVDAMEADGLVRRHSHPTDGRSTMVALTAEGSQSLAASGEQHQDAIAAVFGDLSSEDQAQLLTISRTLTTAMRDRMTAASARVAAFEQECDAVEAAHDACVEDRGEGE